MFSIIAVVAVAAFFVPATTAQTNPWTVSGSDIYNANTGNVGIGTTTPATRLHVNGGLTFCETAHSDVMAGVGTLSLIDTSTVSTGIGSSIAFRSRVRTTHNPPSAPGFALIAGIKASKANGTEGNYGGDLLFFSRSEQDNVIRERLRIDSEGYVGIGTDAPLEPLDVNGTGRVRGNFTVGQIGGTAANATITGNLTVNGTFQAKYQDLAEWVPATDFLAAGSVVALDSTRTNTVVKSTRAYDSTVAGVISPKPGIALGESGPSKALVATTGRVLVKANTTAGPIVIGDLLVTSSASGEAMRSVPIRVGDADFHRPGTILGKALEPLPDGSGEILVLLSLQ